MNHTYQHKKGPPKMIKDLKYGVNAHLRQSLLDISEIENLNKIFLGRKDHYRIEGQSIQPTSKQKENSDYDDEQSQFIKQEFVLSPEQNLQLIKKQRLTNQMKDKMNQMFKQQEIRKYKMRKPVIHRLLEEFKESFRVDEQPKIKEALKYSQQSLEHIKINNKKRISSNYIRGNSSLSRSKFVSISTGKPVITQNYFPSFLDFVQGKYKVKQEPFVGINIDKIDSYFNTMITEPNIPSYSQKKNSKDDYVKYMNKQIFSKPSVCKSRNQSPQINSNEVSPSKVSISNAATTIKRLTKLEPFNRNVRSKSAVNSNANFIRSQQSSKKIISAMTNYYNVKKQKTQQCDSIVGYLKKDRPLTSHIRRKNYTIIGRGHAEDLRKYRNKAEQQRKGILQKNYDFYITLLKIFQHCKEQQIKTSLKILDRLREFFESEYVIFQHDVKQICRLQAQQKIDFGVNIILQNLLQFARKQENFSTQNEQEYQIL